jgi:hypothetical protein
MEGRGVSVRTRAHNLLCSGAGGQGGTGVGARETKCEGRVRDGPASGEQGSKDRN